jgi:hypothetical protein
MRRQFTTAEIAALEAAAAGVQLGWDGTNLYVVLPSTPDSLSAPAVRDPRTGQETSQ